MLMMEILLKQLKELRLMSEMESLSVLWESRGQEKRHC